MPALAMGLGFVGYSLGLWGYCLLRGYNVTLGSLMSPAHPPRWADITGSQIPAGSVFPFGPPAPGAGTQAGLRKSRRPSGGGGHGQRKK